MSGSRRWHWTRTRIVLLLTALAAAMVATVAVATAGASSGCTDTWNQPTGGDWGVAADWTVQTGPDTGENNVPTSSDVACWASGITLTVDSSDTAAQAASVSGGSLDIDGGTLTLGSSSADDSSLASLEIDPGGTLAGPGRIAVTGNLSITGGTIGANNTPAAPTITSGSMTATDSGSVAFDAGSITVDGPVTIDTTYFSSPNDGTASLTDVSPTHPIVLEPGSYGEDDGYMTVTSADGFGISGYTDPLNYRLVQTGGTTVVPSGAGLTPGDTVQLQGGTFQVDGRMGVGVNVTGGTLDGIGDIDSTVTNPSGTVAPGDAGAVGTLTILNFDQTGGTLDIQVDGTLAGDYSVLSVTGAELSGTLALLPSSSYANSASQGDSVPILPYTSLTGTFASTTVTPPLHDGEPFFAYYDTSNDRVDAQVGAPTETTPVNSAPPEVTGGTVVGDTLTTTTGTWSGNPTYTYQWEDCGSAAVVDIVERDPNVESLCTDISSATGSSYVLTNSDVGKYVEVIVTATVSPGVDGSELGTPVKGPITEPTQTTTTQTTTPTVSAPASVAAPSITGTPLPGDTLTCDPGTWTGSPTFTYQWVAGTSPITGATTKTYTVTILDEGQTITCAVTAHNTAGTTTKSTPGVIVAQKGTLTCPKPSGSFSANKIGPLALGETQSAARKALKKYTITHYGFDNFCLYGGWGIRGAYKAKKFVLLLTANPYYKVKGVSPGDTLKALSAKVKLGKVIVIGANDWYIATGSSSNDAFKVRKGIVQEIGIANKKDSSGSHTAQKRFLSSFKAV